MKNELNINQIIEIGEIKSELELERVSVAERKLRALAKKDTTLKSKRKKLRDLIADYESKHWTNDSLISESQINESNNAEEVVGSQLAKPVHPWKKHR